MDFSSPLNMLMLSAATTLFATSFGAIPAFFFTNVPKRVQDLFLGFSAGIMLAATCFSLLSPAIEVAFQSDRLALASGLYLSISVLAGAAFLFLCNYLIPHEHFDKGVEGVISSYDIKRIWLFVIAIAIHNLPEGLAVGTGAGSLNQEIALPLFIGIGLQDIPEGFVVVIALMAVSYNRWQALGVAVLTGLLEAIAAVVGFFAAAYIEGFLPWALAFAGGSMLYVICDEIIPESSRSPYSKQVTAAFMVGFVLMMFLDISL